MRSLLSILFFCSIFSISAQSYKFLQYPSSDDTLISCEPISLAFYTNSNSYYVVEYSVDSGITWINAVSFLRGQYQVDSAKWYPPQIDSDQCILRVGGSNKIYDVMPHTFSLRKANTPHNLLSPNGGEVFTTKHKELITWTSGNNDANVNLYYSSNDGVSWTSYDLGTVPNTGSYQWELPNSIGDEFKIKIAKTGDQCLTDQSDSAFTIKVGPYITSFVPNLTFHGNRTYYQWAGNYLLNDTADIYLSSDSGFSWTKVVSKLPKSARSYWTLSDSINSENCFIKAVQIDDSTVYGKSDKFYIGPSKTTIKDLEQGDTLYSCESAKIDIYPFGDFGINPLFDFYISVDGTANWKLVKQNFKPYQSPYSKFSYSSTSFNFTTINAESSDCYFKIVSHGDTSITTISKQFVISNRRTEFINLLNPTAGENLGTGEQIDVFIDTDYSFTKHLYLSTDGGRSWESQIRFTGTDSSAYTVPNIVSDSCLLVIYGNDCVTDTTDNFFSIVEESHLVLTPLSPINAYGFNYFNVNWITTNGSGFVNINYSMDNGSTWILADSNIVDAAKYKFRFPNDSTSGFLLQVTDANIPNATDIINRALTITPSSITLDATFDTTTQYGCTSHAIPHSYVGRKAVYAYLSLDSAATWEKLETASYGSYFSIYKAEIPNQQKNSDKCFIKLTDSDASISVISPMFALKQALVLESFNGGEYFQLGDRLDVNWDWSTGNSYDYVEVSLSRDGGESWTNIIKYTSNDGDYLSNYLNGDTSFNAKISVTSMDNHCIADTSDNFFAISNVSNEERLKLEGIKQTHWRKDKDTIAIFNHQLFNACVKIEISYDGENTWETLEDAWPISQDTAGYSYYPWTVRDTNSTSCKFRVQECNNPNLVAKSTAFSIKEGYYTVSGIHRSDSLKGCTPVKIEWRGTGHSNNATGYYSIDGAKTWIEMEGEYEYYSWRAFLYWEFPNIDAQMVWIKIKSNIDSNDSLLTGPVTISAIQAKTNLLEPDNKSLFTSHENNFFSWTKSANVDSIQINFFDLEGNLLDTKYSSADNSDSIYIEPDMGPLVDIHFQDHYGCSVDTLKNVSLINNPFIETNLTDYQPYFKSDVNSIKINSGNLPEGSNGIYVSYSTNGGTSWKSIGKNYSYFTWYTPNLASKEVVFKFQAFGTNDTVEVYSEVFEIHKRTFEFITPGNGDLLYGCAKELIQWKNIYPKDETISYYLYFSTDSGISWSNVVNWQYAYRDSTDISSFNWPVPGSNPSKNCLLKIVDRRDSDNYAISDLFEIYVDSTSNIEVPIIMESPIYELDSVTIKWEATSDIDSVEILWFEGFHGNAKGVIWFNVPNTGEYKSKVPYMATEDAFVFISDVRGCAWNRSIEMTVKKRPSIYIQINSKAGSIVPGDSFEIAYGTRYLESDSLILEFSEDNGQTWQFIANIINPLGNRDLSWAWTVDSSFADKELLFKLTDINNDNIFKVSQPQEVVFYACEILSPQEGDLYEPGSATWITWNTSLIHADTNYFEFSSNGGQTWEIINVSSWWIEGGQDVRWEVPNINSTDCIIRHRSEKYITESGMFTIGTLVSNSEITNESGTLYPNPTTGNIYLDGFENVTSMTLLNPNGSILQTIKNYTDEIVLESYPPGVYFLQINLKNTISTRRIVKLK